MTRKEALRQIAMKRMAASDAIQRFARLHGIDPAKRRYSRTRFGGEYRVAIRGREAAIGFELSPREREALAP